MLSKHRVQVRDGKLRQRFAQRSQVTERMAWIEKMTKYFEAAKNIMERKS